MTNTQKEFLESYYKAGNSSDPKDWLSASLAAKRMYNEIRNKSDEQEEFAIRTAAAARVHGYSK